MSGSCCDKPIAKIIKVGDTEAGIIGLEYVLRDVYLAVIKDEKQLQRELLVRVKALGNYISPSRKEAYKQALLREYRTFCQALEEKAKAETRAEAAPPAKSMMAAMIWADDVLVRK